MLQRDEMRWRHDAVPERHVDTRPGPVVAVADPSDTGERGHRLVAGMSAFERC